MGLFAIHRRRRKARSLWAWLPNSAVPMIVNATASSIASVTERRRGSAAPMPIGVPSEVRPMPAVRQGTRGAVAVARCPAGGAVCGRAGDLGT